MARLEPHGMAACGGGPHGAQGGGAVSVELVGSPPTAISELPQAMPREPLWLQRGHCEDVLRAIPLAEARLSDAVMDEVSRWL